MYLSTRYLYVHIIHDCISKCIKLKSLRISTHYALKLAQFLKSPPKYPWRTGWHVHFLKLLSSCHAQIFHIYKRKYLEQPESEPSRSIEELFYNWITYLFPIFLLFRVVILQIQDQE